MLLSMYFVTFVGEGGGRGFSRWRVGQCAAMCCSNNCALYSEDIAVPQVECLGYYAHSLGLGSSDNIAMSMAPKSGFEQATGKL